MAKTFGLLLAFHILLPLAYGQQEVGNGGDPVELIFGKARVDALTVIQRFSSSHLNHDLSQHFDEDVRSFLFQEWQGQPIHVLMSDDIRNSRHLFFDPEIEPIPQSTCARTNLPDAPGAIRFSLPKCRTLLIEKGQDLAQVVLLHESTHHFGVGGSPDEEDFAWRVGEQLLTFFNFLRDRNLPYWQQLSLAGVPEARYQHGTTLVQTTESLSQVFIWGGCNYSRLPNRESCEHYLDSGAVLTVTGGRDADRVDWTATSAAPTTVSPRKLHGQAMMPNEVLPGKQVLIWGGCNGTDASCGNFPREGALFSVDSGEWQIVHPPEQVVGRIHHSMNFLGDEVVILGGLSADRQLPKDAYKVRFQTHDETSSRWEKLDLPVELTGRYGHSAIALRGELVIFGGCARMGLVQCGAYLKDGFRFDGRNWQMLPPLPPAFSGRAFHSASVIGDQMVIWGGQNGFRSALGDGAILDGRTWQWTLIPNFLPEGETGRFYHRSSVIGEKLYVFGGESGLRDFKESVLEFSWLSGQPDQQSWRVVGTDMQPIGRKWHSQVALPQGLLIWGGYGANETYLPTGAVLHNLTR